MGDRRRGRWPTEGRLEQMHRERYAGVAVDPVPLTAGEEVTVLYQGLLAEKGAEQVWLHVGYGPADRWENVTDYAMEKTGWGWVKKLRVEDAGRFNFCFHDNANNWDNNGGLNWSYEVHHGAL
ncbi:MAG: carbohydrate-binding protein [Clostridia bacterium]|nr:carbohydrate-binding protein [Clostridia bacterium]